MLIDTGAWAGGYDAVFDYRNSGLSNTAFGNPSADLLNQAIRAIGGGVRAPFDSTYDYSREDFRRATSSLPWQNLTIIRNGLQAIASQLPDHSEE